MVMKEKMRMESLSQEVIHLDRSVQMAREYLTEQLNWLLFHAKENLSSLAMGFNWPTIQICQELGLSFELCSVILNAGSSQTRAQGETTGAHSENDKDAYIQELKGIVNTLKQER